MSNFEGAVKTADGVSLNGVVLAPVVEQCAGCNRAQEFEGASYCSAYPNPARKWALGNCNFATHITNVVGGSGKKVNPLKASKRASKGK